jgi:serine/threonine-protein phosphatase 4 regulatory subunit 4
MLLVPLLLQIKLCVEDFSTSKCCHKRKMFIEICIIAYELYSRAFFKNWFYEHLVELASDPVVIVRIAFIKVVTKLKLLWNTVFDKAKLNTLDALLSRLLLDKDRDVRELTEKVKRRLNKEALYSYT